MSDSSPGEPPEYNVYKSRKRLRDRFSPPGANPLEALKRRRRRGGERGPQPGGGEKRRGGGGGGGGAATARRRAKPCPRHHPPPRDQVARARHPRLDPGL